MTPLQTVSTGETAGLLRRCGAMLYDGLLLLALWMVAALFFVILGHQTTAELVYWQTAANVLIAWGFFVWFWTHGGQTLGMQAWNIRLYSLAAGTQQPQISLWLASLRFLVALAQWLFILLGIYLARQYGPGAMLGVTVVLVAALGVSVLHPQRLMLHDWLSRTLLVRVSLKKD